MVSICIFFGLISFSLMSAMEYRDPLIEMNYVDRVLFMSRLHSALVDAKLQLAMERMLEGEFDIKKQIVHVKDADLWCPHSRLSLLPAEGSNFFFLLCLDCHSQKTVCEGGVHEFEVDYFFTEDEQGPFYDVISASDDPLLEERCLTPECFGSDCSADVQWQNLIDY